MALTKVRKSGTSKKRLSDKQWLFCEEYMGACKCNATKAAIAAGYSEKTAGGIAVKLMRNPLVKNQLGKLKGKSQKRYEATREEIIEQLGYCATRSGRDFVDKDGILIQNVQNLPTRAQDAIDGIKQRRKIYKLDDGTTVEEIETELKLVPKAQAIDMAMKHKGLFAAEKVQQIQAIMRIEDLEKVSDVEDPIESRLAIERKNLEKL